MGEFNKLMAICVCPIFGPVEKALIHRLITITSFHYQGLVMAGIGDLTRPVEKLSVAQSASLTATGLIWSRYSLVITPKNWGLFSVNVFVALTSGYQLSRVIRHQYFSDNKS